VTLATHPVKMTTDLAGAVLPNPVLTASGCAAAGRELQPFAPVSTPEATLLAEIRDADPERLTPLEALALVDRWKRRLQ